MADVPSSGIGKICVPSGQHWHCSKDSVRVTAERRGRAHMGLSECGYAILSAESRKWTQLNGVVWSISNFSLM